MTTTANGQRGGGWKLAGALAAACACLAATRPGRAGTAGAAPPGADTVFVEGFESGTFALWEDRGRERQQAILDDARLAHSGSHVLEVTFPLHGDGGWLTRFFLPGYDSLYARYWVRLPPGWRRGTKLISFYGSRADNQWSAAGQAGVCPGGTDYFNLTIAQETGFPPGPTHFYAYYPGMPHDPPGSQACYGSNGTQPGAARYVMPLTIEPGDWHQIEFWAVLNRPGRANGYQRFCIDGTVRGEWTGMTMRTSDVLRLNAFTITNSISGGSPVLQKIWVDDVLVARRRPPGTCQEAR